MKQRLHVTYEVTAEFDGHALIDACDTLRRDPGPQTIGSGRAGTYSLGKFKLLKIVRKK